MNATVRWYKYLKSLLFLKYRGFSSRHYWKPNGVSNASHSHKFFTLPHLTHHHHPHLFPVCELKAPKLPSQLLLKNTSISVPSGATLRREWERVGYWVTYLENAGAVRRPPGVQQIVLPCAHKPFTCGAETSRVSAGRERTHAYTLALRWKETFRWPRTEARWWRHFHSKHLLVFGAGIAYQSQRCACKKGNRLKNK